MPRRARSRERRSAGGAGAALPVAPALIRSGRGIRLALYVGAVIWAFLLIAGFFAPGGWTWGMAGPIGHMENYMISLWAVSLVNVAVAADKAPVDLKVGDKAPAFKAKTDADADWNSAERFGKKWVVVPPTLSRPDPDDRLP